MIRSLTRTLRRPARWLALCLSLSLLAGETSAVPCANMYGLVQHNDGAFEADLSWWDLGFGVAPPDLGAFAQQMQVRGSVDTVVVRLIPRPDLLLTPSVTFDVYVWADASGVPGVLSAAALGVVVPVPEDVGALWTVRIPVSSPVLTRPWCGVRIHPPAGAPNAVGLAADTDSPGDQTPMIKVPPGLGYPTGWRDVTLVFGDITGLGIDAAMCNIEVVGDGYQWVGGGGPGEPVVLTGGWDFEQTLPDEYDAVPCSYSLPDTFGSVIDYQGWLVSPGSSLVPGLQPATLLSAGPDFPSEVDVEGQALWFYDPISGGFPPGHVGMYESPLIPFEALNTGRGNRSIEFMAAADPADSLSLGALTWIIGSRGQRADLSWMPWRDFRTPVRGGGWAIRAPLQAGGGVAQVRLGIENGGGVPVPIKAGAGDKPKAVVAKPETTGFTNGYKPIPIIKQDKAHVCMTVAAASCLAYWAQNGYPELIPAGGISAMKDELADIMQKRKVKQPDGTEKEVGEGMGGIGTYLKRKGVSPNPPKAAPPRPPLEQEQLLGPAATFAALKDQLSRNHDVMLGFQAYRDSAGVQVTVNKNGHPIAHTVTAAQIIEVPGPKGGTVVRVADGHLPNKDPVTNPKDYREYKVEVAPDGTMKLRNKELEKDWPGTEYMCVTEVNVIRPNPPNAPGPVPHAMPAPVAHFGARVVDPDTLVQYMYGLGPDHTVPIRYLAMVIDVDYYEVQSPPGWIWEPLPSLPPGAKGCQAELSPAGIAWRALGPALPPGVSLTGFGFSAHERYEPDSTALHTYVGTTDFHGLYGFAFGPSAEPPTVSVPPGSASAPALSALRAVPNPARGSLMLAFESARAGSGRVTVHDLSGRLVRSFELAQVQAGLNQLAWDRVDDRGHGVPAGLYFYRVQVAGERSVQQVVLLQ